MNFKNVGGLNVSAVTKAEMLLELKERVKSSEKTFAITPYSEFLYESMINPKVREILNHANFATPDGIGMFWASKFLATKFSVQNYYLKIFQAFWQAFYTLASILIYPKFIRSEFPEKIVGADLIWDLCDLAQKNNFSVFLLGGFGNTAEIAAKKLKNKFPNLVVAGVSNKNPDDPEVINELNKLSPDMLFVAYGPIRQETWVYKNLPNLKIKYAIGLGGTFDYLAGKVALPPKVVRFVGLEWLWRLITQPYRWKRIYNATFGLVRVCIRYKVFSSMPMRKNAAVVILNSANQVLVCERNPNDFFIDVVTSEDELKVKNYWQLPQGGIDKNESTEDCAIREAREEVGLTNLTVKKIMHNAYSYEWTNANRRLLRNSSYQNRGQSQDIVVLNHLGKDSDVKVDGREFIAYKWVNPSQLSQIIHPERAGLTKIVENTLKTL